jgi:hypothetical protein
LRGVGVDFRRLDVMHSIADHRSGVRQVGMKPVIGHWYLLPAQDDAAIPTAYAKQAPEGKALELSVYAAVNTNAAGSLKHS